MVGALPFSGHSQFEREKWDPLAGVAVSEGIGHPKRWCCHSMRVFFLLFRPPRSVFINKDTRVCVFLFFLSLSGLVIYVDFLDVAKPIDLSRVYTERVMLWVPLRGGIYMLFPLRAVLEGQYKQDFRVFQCKRTNFGTLFVPEFCFHLSCFAKKYSFFIMYIFISTGFKSCLLYR